MQNELKPCPFCGGEVTVDYNSYTKVYSIGCGNAGCACNVGTLPCKTAEKAIEIWNRRTNNATD